MNEPETTPRRSFQVRHFINAHKILTPFLVAGGMEYFDCWEPLAWVYLALHGGYCLLWMIKESAFRDQRFEADIHPVAGLLFVFVPLAAYWIAPYLIVSRHLTAPAWLMALAIIVTLSGVFFHFASDAHKHAVLRIRKGLITDGLFARCRNPNYLGEMLIYAGFAMLARHWIVLLPLAYWWSYFFHNMLRKDASLSRYPGFEDWKRRSGLLIPKLF